MTGARRGTLWAITCYFDPVGFKRRIANYRLFRQRLAAPLVTVELSFDGAFQLRHDDADILVQLHGHDVMWQKERLLNLALKWLPDGCDKVAWLDCDVIFGSDDWVAQAEHALDEFSLLHLYQERHDLPQEARSGQLESWTTPSPAISMIHRMAAEGVAPGELLLTHPRQNRRSANGLAWASPRAILDAHGLYDACILGSGDRAVLCAGSRTFDYCTRGLLMTCPAGGALSRVGSAVLCNRPRSYRLHFWPCLPSLARGGAGPSIRRTRSRSAAVRLRARSATSLWTTTAAGVLAS